MSTYQVHRILSRFPRTRYTIAPSPDQLLQKLGVKPGQQHFIKFPQRLPWWSSPHFQCRGHGFDQELRFCTPCSQNFLKNKIKLSLKKSLKKLNFFFIFLKFFIEFVTILLLFYVLIFFFFFGQEARRILVPQPGIKPATLDWKVKS